MFEMQGGFRVMHWHGDAEWAPMSEGSGEDVASHDPERRWLKRGARLFRCAQCQEEIAIVPDDPVRSTDAEPHAGR